MALPNQAQYFELTIIGTIGIINVLFSAQYVLVGKNGVYTCNLYVHYTHLHLIFHKENKFGQYTPSNPLIDIKMK